MPIVEWLVRKCQSCTKCNLGGWKQPLGEEWVKKIAIWNQSEKSTDPWFPPRALEKTRFLEPLEKVSRWMKLKWEGHRWALSPISVMSDIGLILYRTVRYRTERLKICRIFRYRTKVFSDIRHLNFWNHAVRGALKKQTELNLHLATVTFESFAYLTTNFLLLMRYCMPIAVILFAAAYHKFSLYCIM
jgi:hypothetical protein